MSAGIEHIGKKDVIWSFLATFFKVGAGMFILPVILRCMSSETVALWNVFLVITSLVLLLDFGFRPSFARNISYIFSGVRELQAEGVVHVEENASIDYSLLKGTITAMRRFYARLALLVLLLLLLLGTPYFFYILTTKYQGNHVDAIMAWFLLCAVNCYELYTYYYDALMTGKGYIKRSQQIMILSRAAYLMLAMPMVYMGFGLVSIVLALTISIILRRFLSYRVFFNPEMKENLRQAQSGDTTKILKAISPNAMKVGLTYLGGFLVNKSTILLGTLFLSLEEIAVYGITMQVMDVLTQCATIFVQLYTPLIAAARAKSDMAQMKGLYYKSTVALVTIIIFGGFLWILCGDFALTLIGGQTKFLPTTILTVLLLIQLLEKNHVVASLFIQADNRIPFYIPSLLSGMATVILLWLMLTFTELRLWAFVLAPGIAQLCYQNWKWPLMVIQELRQAR